MPRAAIVLASLLRVGVGLLLTAASPIAAGLPFLGWAGGIVG